MIAVFQRMLKIDTIRKRMLLYFLLISLLMVMISIYTFYQARQFLFRVDQMFIGNVYLNELSQNVNVVESSLTSYLSTKDSDSLVSYNRYSDELRKKADKISTDVSYRQNQLMLKDISNMIREYLVQGDAAIAAKRGRNIEEYINRYTEAKQIAGYIDIYIHKLNLNQFQNNTQRYLDMSKKLNVLQILNIAMIVDTILLSTILIMWFTYKMTKPIIGLSHSADEISKGNFEADEVVVSTDDEIKVMAGAFNRMKESIRSYIEELKNQAEIEARFMEEKMQNLRMKNLLKNAELQALQSQINPHFLFNTLNAGVQLAMIEGADKTGEFLENMSKLFRYNIRKMDKPVTLKEEIENSCNYMYLLKTRFADLIEFVYEIDETVTEIMMPAMILQPLIENAYIHGIGDMERGGMIGLYVRRIDHHVEVTIEDNGRGMDKEIIDRILQGETQEEDVKKEHKKGHTTGIGMNNVIHRLRLFFDRKDVIDIISSRQTGTKVIICMPINN